MKALVLLFLFLSATRLDAQIVWQPTAGPYGGFVSSLIVDRDGRIFAGTGRGIYRSLDNGSSWSPIVEGIDEPGYVQAMALDSSQRLYAYLGRSLQQRGELYTSTNRGTEWVRTATPDWPNGIASLAVTRSGSILAGTRNYGMFRSTDQGGAWNRLGSIAGGGVIYAIATAPDGVIFTGIHSLGAFRSIDDGDTWISDSLELGYVTAFAFSRGYVFAGSARDIYRREETGWRKMTPDTLQPYIRDLAVGADGTIYGSTWETGVVRSTDDGVTWTIIDRSIVPTGHAAIEVGREGRLILGSDGTGIYTSTDRGESWTQNNERIRNTSISALLRAPDGSLLAGGSAGLHRTTDDGETWTSTGSDLVNRYHWNNLRVTSLTAGRAGRLFATLEYDGLFHSENNGVSWQKADSSLRVRYPARFYTTALAPNGYLYTGAYGIYRSTDNGESWEARSAGMRDSSIAAIAVDSSGGVIAVTSNRIYLSVNNGERWSTTGGSYGGTQQLVVTPRGIIVGAANDGVRLGRRSGDSIIWSQPADTLFSNRPFRSVAVGRNGELVIGDYEGRTYISRDDGENWGLMSTALSGRPVLALDLSRPGMVFASTGGDGVYRGTMTSSVGVTDRVFDRVGISIHVEPNPFSNRTRIDLVLADPGPVTVTIYSMHGEQVATLRSTVTTAGAYSLAWETAGFAPGAYLCVVRSGGARTASQLLVVR